MAPRHLGATLTQSIRPRFPLMIPGELRAFANEDLPTIRYISREEAMR
jgi:hypothetical protein